MRCLLFALLQMTAAAAFAQVALVDSLPADDAVLQHAPADLTLRFNQPVKPLVFKLLLPDGSVQLLQRIDVTTDGVKIGLPLSTLQGTYLLSWKVAPADGRPVGGALTYSLGVRSGICVVNQGTGTASVWLGVQPNLQPNLQPIRREGNQAR